MSRGKHILYSEAELAWMKSHRTWSRRKAHQKFCKTFGRSDVGIANYKALCKRNGWLTGRTGRFDKGLVPVNKGKKCPEGTGGKHPNARKTHFKRGVRQGVAVKLYKPIGTERITKDGYLERKINDGLPLQARWRAVHLIRWEEKNGKLAAGMCLKCLDGNRQNTDPSNWVPISRGALPFLNGHRGYNYEEMAAGLKPAVLTLAKLKNAKSKAIKKEDGA